MQGPLRHCRCRRQRLCRQWAFYRPRFIKHQLHSSGRSSNVHNLAMHSTCMPCIQHRSTTRPITNSGTNCMKILASVLLCRAIPSPFFASNLQAMHSTLMPYKSNFNVLFFFSFNQWAKNPHAMALPRVNRFSKRLSLPSFIFPSSHIFFPPTPESPCASDAFPGRALSAFVAESTIDEKEKRLNGTTILREEGQFSGLVIGDFSCCFSPVVAYRTSCVPV